MHKQHHDYPYIQLLKNIKEYGIQKGDRTGTGTMSVFARDMVFNLSDGTIPLITNKKMHQPSIFHELLWYISGDSNIKYLQDNGVRIWNEWADSAGDLGPVYGALWRKWPRELDPVVDYSCDPLKAVRMIEYVDQLGDVISRIKTNPDCRRLIVNCWKPDALPDTTDSFSENVAKGKQALPPCHYSFQFYVANGVLSLKLTQRSADVFLGVPFNIAQYSILLHMVAYITKLKVGEFTWSGGDVHIYNNHLDQVNTFIERTPFESPTLSFARTAEEIGTIDGFQYSDFIVENYNHHERITAEVAI